MQYKRETGLEKEFEVLIGLMAEMITVLPLTEN
jgi:hypothetical protein